MPVLVASIIVLHLERQQGSESWMWVLSKEDGCGLEGAVVPLLPEERAGGKVLQRDLWSDPLGFASVAVLCSFSARAAVTVSSTGCLQQSPAWIPVARSQSCRDAVLLIGITQLFACQQRSDGMRQVLEQEIIES